MKKHLLIVIVVLGVTNCGGGIDVTKLPGVWELAGERCDEAGACKREIYTDADSREKFTDDGLYINPHARNRYEVRRGTIYFADDKNAFTVKYAEIIRVDDRQLLLRVKSGIRRYARVSL